MLFGKERKENLLNFAFSLAPSAMCACGPVQAGHVWSRKIRSQMKWRVRWAAQGVRDDLVSEDALLGAFVIFRLFSYIFYCDYQRLITICQ